MASRRDLPVRGALVIPAEEIREAATRSSGPGGQHVNKTSTRVTLRWNVQASGCLRASQRRRLCEKLATRLTRTGDLVVNCDRTRSRARNRDYARERIVELVSTALVRQRPRKPTKPTKASRARRRTEKVHRAKVKRTRTRVGPDSDP
jgi:ribosome-associated protein